MENQRPAIFNWSGGKDSMLALHQVLQEGQYDVRYLLTTINDAYNRVSMHGVRESHHPFYIWGYPFGRPESI